MKYILISVNDCDFKIVEIKQVKHETLCFSQ